MDETTRCVASTAAARIAAGNNSELLPLNKYDALRCHSDIVTTGTASHLARTIGMSVPASKTGPVSPSCSLVCTFKIKTVKY